MANYSKALAAVLVIPVIVGLEYGLGTFWAFVWFYLIADLQWLVITGRWGSAKISSVGRTSLALGALTVSLYGSVLLSAPFQCHAIVNCQAWRDTAVVGGTTLAVLLIAAVPYFVWDWLGKVRPSS